MNLISKILFEARKKEDNNIFQPRRVESRRKPIDDFEAKMAKDFPIGSYAQVLLVYGRISRHVGAHIKSEPRYDDLLGDILGMQIKVKLPNIGVWSGGTATAYWKKGLTDSSEAGTIDQGHWQIGGNELNK